VSELERHPAAQRVADDVGSVDAEFLEQPADGSRQRGRVWFLLRRKGFRVTEAWEVDGEHVEAFGERGNNGVEGPPDEPRPCSSTSGAPAPARVNANRVIRILRTRYGPPRSAANHGCLLPVRIQTK